MDNPWGCHSKPRAEGYWASAATVVKQFGCDFFRVQEPVWIKDTGSLECQYRKATPTDPRCEGCTSP